MLLTACCNVVRVISVAWPLTQWSSRVASNKAAGLLQTSIRLSPASRTAGKLSVPGAALGCPELSDCRIRNLCRINTVDEVPTYNSTAHNSNYTGWDTAKSLEMQPATLS